MWLCCFCSTATFYLPVYKKWLRIIIRYIENKKDGILLKETIL